MAKNVWKNGLVNGVAVMGQKLSQEEREEEKKKWDQERDDKKFELKHDTYFWIGSLRKKYPRGTVMYGRDWRKMYDNHQYPAFMSEILRETDKEVS